MDSRLRGNDESPQALLRRTYNSVPAFFTAAVIAPIHAAIGGRQFQIRRREPERVYWAVVYGRPDPASGRWADRLVWDEAALIQKQTHPRDPNGADAVADYRVLETFRATALVEVRLHTGKRNQIRIQARLRGHTLVGEQRYVFGPASLRPIVFPRQALHAAHLGFVHPVTGRALQFDAPLPADLLRASYAEDAEVPYERLLEQIRTAFHEDVAVFEIGPPVSTSAWVTT